MSEDPKLIHGRLLEAVHLSGYAFGRAATALEYLIDEDRWLACGYEEFGAFLATVDMSPFNLERGERKRLAEKIAGKGASQRAAARALGVAEGTVRNDLKPAQDCAPEPEEPAPLLVPVTPDAQDCAPDETANHRVVASDPERDSAPEPDPEPEAQTPPPPQPQPMTEEERRREREEREYAAVVRRARENVETLLAVLPAVTTLREAPYRPDVLASLSEYDRDMFLRIEQEARWPASTA